MPAAWRRTAARRPFPTAGLVGVGRDQRGGALHGPRGGHHRRALQIQGLHGYGIHMTFSLRVTLERITLERTSPLPRPGSPHKLDSPEHSSTSSRPQTLRHGRHQQAASGNSGGRLCHSLQNVAARSSAAAEAALPRQSSHDESSECEEIQRIHGRLHNAEDEPSDDVDSAIGDIVSAQRDRSTRRVLSMGFDLASIRGVICLNLAP